jgi:thioredoxin reductase (NADPH)
VFGKGEVALNKAKFLRTYSRDVWLILPDDERQDEAALREAGIALVRPPVTLKVREGKVCVSSVGGLETFDVLYPSLGCKARSDLARALGAESNDVGCLKVDEHQQTTVGGLYAAGDVVSDLHQIAVGTGHAAIAATHIHKILPFSPR